MYNINRNNNTTTEIMFLTADYLSNGSLDLSIGNFSKACPSDVNVRQFWNYSLENVFAAYVPELTQLFTDLWFDRVVKTDMEDDILAAMVLLKFMAVPVLLMRNMDYFYQLAERFCTDRAFTEIKEICKKVCPGYDKIPAPYLKFLKGERFMNPAHIACNHNSISGRSNTLFDQVMLAFAKFLLLEKQDDDSIHTICKGIKEARTQEFVNMIFLLIAGGNPFAYIAVILEIEYQKQIRKNDLPQEILESILAAKVLSKTCLYDRDLDSFVAYSCRLCNYETREKITRMFPQAWLYDLDLNDEDLIAIKKNLPNGPI